MEVHVGLQQTSPVTMQTTSNTPSILHITCVEAAVELADCIAVQALIKFASVIDPSAPAEM